MPMSNNAKESDTDEKVRLTLIGMPDSSAAQVALAVGIGKSTAGKALARLHAQGRVNRTPGGIAGGRRTPDHWTAVVPDDAPAPDSGDDASQDADGGESVPVAVPLVSGEVVGRLAPGALRGMVEDYLRDNPGEFSPTAIGRALARSAGAVHNALEKLVAAGCVTRTCDQPKRYTLAAQEANGAEHGQGR